MTSDKDRLCGGGANTNDWYSSRGALYDTLREDDLQDAILLILYNKSDLVTSYTSEADFKARMDALFNIEDIKKTGRKCHSVCTTAITGEGLYEGMDWLCDTLKNKKKSPVGGDDHSSNDSKEKGNGSVSPTTAAATAVSSPEEALLVEWLQRVDDDDDVFLQKLEDATLELWDHYTHLRIAYLNLSRHGRRVGMSNIFRSIQSFIERSPRTKRSDISRGTTFHETMTYFWVHMVDYAMHTMAKVPSTTPSSALKDASSSSASSSVEDMSSSSSSSSSGTQLNPFKIFLLLNPQLSNGGLFLHYFSKKRMLLDAEARTSVLLPDLRPLPSLLTDISSSSINSISIKPIEDRLLPRAPLSDEEFIDSVHSGGALMGYGHDIKMRIIYLSLASTHRSSLSSSSSSPSSSSSTISSPTVNTSRASSIDTILSILRGIEKEHFHLTINYFWIQMVHYYIALLKKEKQQLLQQQQKSNAAWSIFYSTNSKSPDVDNDNDISMIMPFEAFYREPKCQKLRNSLLYEHYYSRWCE